MDNQQPRPIPSFPSYLATPEGEIISTKGEYKTKHTTGSGYYSTVLFKEGRTHRPLVHRLIAETFLGDVKGKVVNHLDNNRKNNHYLNLEIGTQKDNMHHARSLGVLKTGELHPSAKLTELQVHEICKVLSESTWSKQLAIDLGKRYGVSWQAIRNIKQNHRWKEVSKLYW